MGLYECRDYIPSRMDVFEVGTLVSVFPLLVAARPVFLTDDKVHVFLPYCIQYPSLLTLVLFRLNYISISAL